MRLHSVFIFSGMPLKTTNYLVAASVVAVLALSLFTREILLVFTTRKYIGAVGITPLLAAYTAFFYLGLQMSLGIHIAKKTIYFTVISIITAVVTIILNIVLVPLYGMTGAAVATLAGSIVWCVLLVYQSQVYYRIEYKYGAFMIMLVVTAVIILISTWFFMDVNLLNIVIKMGLIIVVAALTYYAGLIGKSELDYGKSIIKKLFFKGNL